jgi:hypothetical protein
MKKLNIFMIIFNIILFFNLFNYLYYNKLNIIIKSY